MKAREFKILGKRLIIMDDSEYTSICKEFLKAYHEIESVADYVWDIWWNIDDDDEDEPKACEEADTISMARARLNYIMSRMKAFRL